MGNVHAVIEAGGMGNRANDDERRKARSTLAQMLAALSPLNDPGPEPADGDDHSDADCGWTIFDCALHDGIPVPLKPADREHPLIREIADRLSRGDQTGSGIALNGYLALIAGDIRGQSARVMVLGDHAIIGRLRAITHHGQVSPAELRVLKQLVCGIDLADAARLDGVSHETRRSQFKSLAHKLSVRSQGELVSRTLTQIFADPASPPTAGHRDDDGLFIELAEEFLPYARCHRLQDASGEYHRVIELGPPQGRPVILIHPQMLPDLRDEDMAALEVLGVRLIVPLRHGAMAWPGNALGVADHLDHACNTIDIARRHFCGPRADLLACISGTAYAIEYAHRHCERVASLGFAGTPVIPVSARHAGGWLRSSLLRLATGEVFIFARTMDIFFNRIWRPDIFRKLLLSYYRACPADLAIIETEYAAPHGGERARRLCLASLRSIRHDLYYQVRRRWERLPIGQFPMAFFHGAADIHHPVEAIQALSNEFGGLPVNAIPDAGQLLYYHHFEPLLKSYATFLKTV